METSTTCTSCLGRDFRTLANGSCPCNNGFYDKAISLCDVCDRVCVNCESTSTKCTSCDPAMMRISIPINNSCDCLDGFYDDSFSNDCK